MTKATGGRIRWADLPAHVRAAAEEIIGGTVVEAVSQAGGFSPGTADRVRAAAGGRAFVKAVSTTLNKDSVRLHRQEARVTAALPHAVPAPRLLGSYEEGGWIALVLEDVEGRHPATPWRADELDRVLETLGAAPTWSPVPRLTDAADSMAKEFAGWRDIAADPPADLDPWAVRRLDTLCELAARGLSAVAGDTLVHTDLRADNILLGVDGQVTLVDWPWACRGAAWLDQLLLLINVRLHGGHDTTALLSRHLPNADLDDVVAVLAGFAGNFLHNARQPSPPGLPTVRAVQRVQGEAVLSWLRELIS